MFQSSWFQLSAIDWIKSPLEVPIPTQREASPVDPVGAFGKTSVDVASRIQEPEPTGPVLNAGPMAALTDEVSVAATKLDRSWRADGMVVG
jgi:hypothetical protein